MTIWALYLASLGTMLSVVGWLWFVYKNNNPSHPATLSELAARSQKNRWYFRTVLWVCGPLFAASAIAMIPAVDSGLLIWLWLIAVALELLVGIFIPTNRKNTILHNIVAYGMAVSMWLSTVVAAFYLSRYMWLLLSLAGFMMLCAILASRRQHKFVIYELGFLFCAHLGMVVSVLAVL